MKVACVVGLEPSGDELLNQAVRRSRLVRPLIALFACAA